MTGQSPSTALPESPSPAEPRYASAPEVRQFIATLSVDNRRELTQRLEYYLLRNSPLRPIQLNENLLCLPRDVLSPLLQDRDDYIHRTAACMLARLGDEEAIKLLGGLLDHEGDPSKLEPVVDALAASGRESAYARLLDTLSHHDLHVRDAAGTAMAQLYRRASTGPAAPFLDKAWEILHNQAITGATLDAHHAVMHMVEFDATDAIEEFVADAEAKTPAVRVAAIHALLHIALEKGAHHVQAAEPVLLNALNDGDKAVRLAAAGALHPYVLEPAVQAQLIQRYKREPDLDVKAKLASVLGHHVPAPWWKHAALVVPLALVLLYAAGFLLYRPGEPLPVDRLPQAGIFGTNNLVVARLSQRLVQIEATGQALSTLALVPGETYRLPCYRDVADYLFFKRRCDVFVFAAESPDRQLAVRFFVYRYAGVPQVIALGTASPEVGSPDGTFLELPPAPTGSHSELALALRDQAQRLALQAGNVSWQEYGPRDKTVLIPFAPGAASQRQITALLEKNPVLAYLVDLTTQRNPQFSMSAPAYTVINAGMDGAYQPSYDLIQRPMLPEPLEIEATLSHELVHAALDTLAPDEWDKLAEELAPYLKDVHPGLFGVTLPRFYGDKVRGEAGTTLAVEEALSFAAGALAAEHTQMHFLITRKPLPTNVSDWVFMNEDLHTEDIEYLVDLALAPEWMRPSKLDYPSGWISADYYKKLRAQQPKPAAG